MESQSINTALLPFQTPCSTLVVGSSQSGKTFLTYKIIRQSKGMFTIPPVKIVYCYSAFQDLYAKMEKEVSNINFHEGLPTSENIEEWSEKKEHMLLILDDLLGPAADSSDIMNLFTIGCHHRNISVIFLMQNMFPPGKCIRTISLNANYIICMRSHREKLQLNTLGRQILPGQSKYFMAAYEQATSKKYGYLLIDLSPHTDKTYLLRTNIFVGEDVIIDLPK